MELYERIGKRMHILTVLAVLIFAALIGRLIYLQLFHGKQYKYIADENRIRTIASEAPRGNIYDRSGYLLVGNRPSFAVSVIPHLFKSPERTVPLLSKILAMPEQEIQALIQAGQKQLFTPIRLKRDITPEILITVEERQAELPGVIIEAMPVRNYVYKQLAAHLLGYVGLISAEEWEALRVKEYGSSDLIGKIGIERGWEDVLRGVNGGRQVEINAEGQFIRLLGEKVAVAGKTITLTLDVNLQKAAEDALDQQIELARQGKAPPAKAGAIVVIHAGTGGILTIVSRPTFDPNAFVGGISSNEWNKLITDSLNPFSNRVYQNAYPPASVFKIVTAAAALETKVTTPTEIFDDKGVYTYGGWNFYGWERKGLGKLNIPDAISWSSDPVFYELGRRLGISKLADYALTFGYGKSTGMALGGEEIGLVPTPEWKEKNIGEPWFGGETIIASIGQGYLLASPLQQALAVMAVANGGVVYRPMIVDKILNPDDMTTIKQYQPEVLRTIYLNPETWGVIRDGMRRVVTTGSAQGAFAGFSYTVAGKTGTAETSGNDHAWFACYAPFEQPEVIVVVFVENGGSGSTVAAPIARKVLEAYFKAKG